MTCICENGQLRVILSETETVRYNIDCVFFECGSERADNALVSLLKTAVNESGFKTRATKFLIEIYPVYDGGCEIYFIPDGEREKLRVKAVAKHSRGSFALFEFSDSESMLSAVEMLYSLGDKKYIDSSLFEQKGRYRLLLSGAKYSELISVCEFAARHFSRAVDRAVTSEYWRPIVKNTAVETVGAALCRRLTRKFPNTP